MTWFRVAAFLGGMSYAIGLGLSGMTLPDLVIAFLDFTGGKWDPTLAFVMVGGIGTYFAFFSITSRLSKPIDGPRFRIPTRRDITPRLIGGAAIFGVGWGLGGLCPGPGLTTLVKGDPQVLIFMGGLVAGMYTFWVADKVLSRVRQVIHHSPSVAKSSTPPSIIPVEAPLEGAQES